MRRTEPSAVKWIMKIDLRMETTLKTKTKNKLGPAFDGFLSSPDFTKDYEKEFKEFALSELMLAIMEDDGKSVRKLAELSGLSPTAIQNMRSGKVKDVKIGNFISIAEACGYELELVKGKKRIPLHTT